MQCPACQKEMVEKDFGGVHVDVCHNGCKGIWFDWLELERLDEHHEGAGQALSDALESDWHKNDNRGQIHCPKCSQLMVAHLYKSCKLVTVDECYGCGGFFLDSGELEVIRGNFMSEQDRDEYLKEMMTTKTEYAAAMENLHREKEAIRQGTVHRAAAAYKLVGVLGNQFKR